MKTTTYHSIMSILFKQSSLQPRTPRDSSSDVGGEQMHTMRRASFLAFFISLHSIQHMYVYIYTSCANTIGTVLVAWAGHFQCKTVNTFFKQNTPKQFYQTALGNCYGLKLPKC